MANQLDNDLIDSRTILMNDAGDIVLSEWNDLPYSPFIRQYNDDNDILLTPTLERSNPFEINRLAFTIEGSTVEQESGLVLDFIADPNDRNEFERLFSTEIINGSLFEASDSSETIDRVNVEQNAIEQAIQTTMPLTVRRTQAEQDKIDLKSIDDAIPIDDRIMTMKIQPPATHRARYKSDGKRHTEKSRTNPTEIKLPGAVRRCLGPNQSFWLETTSITSTDNPKNQPLIHVNKLAYNDAGAIECEDGSIRVPLSAEDCRTAVKKLCRLQNTRTKRDNYTYELIPFEVSQRNTPNEVYTLPNRKKMTLAAKAKKFVEEYDLLKYQFAFRLLIKQNDTWHRTNIVCFSIMMEEKKPPAAPKKQKSPKETVQLSASKQGRKRSKSSTENDTLPVTRVKKCKQNETE